MAENKTMFDRIKELTAGLDEQVTELFRKENLPDFLRTMSHLTGYSLSNILLVHRQRPFSTMLMSFEKWREQGRNVTRGQKGIQIIMPASYTIEVQRDRLDPRTHAPVLDSSGKPVKETVTQERTTFKISTVFDIDQTYGDQYPAIEHASLDRPDVFVDAISYDDFIAVQHLIDNAKYGNKAILPQLQVIADGALKGFVQVNPRWAGFSAAEYEVASESVYEGDYQATSNDNVEAKTGEFDMRGFEVVRAQFISANNRPTVSFAIDTVKFGIECIRKLEGTQYVELLIHPHEKLLAVRKTNKQNKAAVRWSKAMEDGSFAPRPIAGTAFLPILFELFGWSRDCRYRIFGVRKQRGSDSVLLFDMHDTEIFIPKKILESNNTERTETETEFGFRPISAAQRSIIGYPQQWGSRFGSDYYAHTQASQLAIIDNQGEWRIYEEPQTIPSDTKLNVTSPAELEKHIESLVQELKEEKERGIAALER